MLKIIGLSRFHASCRLLSHKPTMYKYINYDELAALIKSDKVPSKDYLVIDVRDDDYEGGNIPKGQNWPSRDFTSKVDELVGKAAGVKTVVFHCALSQVRGPKCAAIYEEARSTRSGEISPQDIFVLRGGFFQFQAKYKDDPVLVENYNEDAWDEE